MEKRAMRRDRIERSPSEETDSAQPMETLGRNRPVGKSIFSPPLRNGADMPF